MSTKTPPILPETFARRVAETLGDEYPAFVAALAAPSLIGVRRNRRKRTHVFADAAPILWCPLGAMLPERPIFALDPLWHAGAYYVQEPSSMLLNFALRQFCDTRLIDTALDLCAAPGGKTTLLADFLEDANLIVANEPIRKRFGILRENVTRYGLTNVVCTNHDPADFAPLAGFFRLVLVDAPCSGEGLFRKDANAIKEWSEDNASLCALRQSRILESAVLLVASGGLLIYSTCTFNPAENDAQIANLLSRNEWEHLRLETPPEWGMEQTAYGTQCWPHRVQGEGFYLSVLQRKGFEPCDSILPNTLPPGYRSALPSEEAPIFPFLKEPKAYRILVRNSDNEVFLTPPSLGVISAVANALPRFSFGIRLGSFKGKDFIPSHELALSVAVNPALLSVELSLPDALRYLRKESPTLPDDTPNGWTLMCYEKIPLGWAKVMPGRVNNYLPTDWRLRLTGGPYQS